MEEQAKRELTVAEAGRLGGIKVRDSRAGTGYYQKIGAMGGKALAAKCGHEHFVEAGRKGGKAPKKKRKKL